ncbi:uncharacterized protein CLUP02_17202 [Colletotrichum lupini]|uniref:Uncharacterized protein n=1 Tax=Colletotrichum lupini TaxID=145971 RepID=A0A9Q8T9A2_9PEZI|nr:uncharacterized protein CLUP02_17202 [Colletotrichum lupini]UQC91666.1 hypothetical protein CLUP02_17202 [Colletotrichum lupini]
MDIRDSQLPVFPQLARHYSTSLQQLATPYRAMRQTWDLSRQRHGQACTHSRSAASRNSIRVERRPRNVPLCYGAILSAADSQKSKAAPLEPGEVAEQRSGTSPTGILLLPHETLSLKVNSAIPRSEASPFPAKPTPTKLSHLIRPGTPNSEPATSLRCGSRAVVQMVVGFNNHLASQPSDPPADDAQRDRGDLFLSLYSRTNVAQSFYRSYRLSRTRQGGYAHQGSLKTQPPSSLNNLSNIVRSPIIILYCRYAYQLVSSHRTAPELNNTPSLGSSPPTLPHPLSTTLRAFTQASSNFHTHHTHHSPSSASHFGPYLIGFPDSTYTLSLSVPKLPLKQNATDGYFGEILSINVKGASAADLLCCSAVTKTAPGGGLKLFRFNRTILCPPSATNGSIDWTRPIFSFRVRRSTQPGQPQMDATRLHYHPRYHLLPIIPALQAPGEAKGEQQVDSGNTCDSCVSTCPPLFALCQPLRCEGPDGRGGTWVGSYGTWMMARGGCVGNLDDHPLGPWTGLACTALACPCCISRRILLTVRTARLTPKVPCSMYIYTVGIASKVPCLALLDGATGYLFTAKLRIDTPTFLVLPRHYVAHHRLSCTSQGSMLEHHQSDQVPIAIALTTEFCPSSLDGHPSTYLAFWLSASLFPSYNSTLTTSQPPD